MNRYRELLAQGQKVLTETEVRQHLPLWVTETLTRRDEAYIAEVASEMWEGDDGAAVLAAYDCLVEAES